MKISTSQMYFNVTQYVLRNRQMYYESQEPLMTNRSINRPSDDPIGAARILDMRQRIGRLEQFQRNIDQATMFQDQAEIALQQTSNALIRLKEIAVDINDGTAGAGEYAAVAQEIDNLYSEVLKASNTQINGRYVFGGYQTTSAPFNAMGIYSGGIGDQIKLEISENDYIPINYTGQEIFKSPNDLFAVIANLRVAVAAGNQTAIANEIPNLTDCHDQIVSYLADVGSRTNRLEMASSDNEELTTAFQSVLSNLQDTDVVEATVKFQKMEEVYQASMSVSSRVLSQSFLDFLR